MQRCNLDLMMKSSVKLFFRQISAVLSGNRDALVTVVQGEVLIV